MDVMRFAKNRDNIRKRIKSPIENKCSSASHTHSDALSEHESHSPCFRSFIFCLLDFVSDDGVLMR